MATALSSPRSNWLNARRHFSTVSSEVMTQGLPCLEIAFLLIARIVR